MLSKKELLTILCVTVNKNTQALKHRQEYLNPDPPGSQSNVLTTAMLTNMRMHYLYNGKHSYF